MYKRGHQAYSYSAGVLCRSRTATGCVTSSEKVAEQGTHAAVPNLAHHHASWLWLSHKHSHSMDREGLGS